MLTIALRARGDRLTYAVEPHVAFVDLPGYETPERRNDTEVDLSEDCCIAPLVARMHGKPAIDTRPDLMIALGKIEQERPDRIDGIDLAALLLSWTERWPTAWFDVSGPALGVMAERGGKAGIDYSGEHNERVSARNVATADLDAPAMGVGEIERAEIWHEPSSCELGLACRSCNRVDGATLQREEKITGHGGGGKGRVRRDRPTRQNRDGSYQRLLQDDGSRTVFVGAKVSAVAKRVLVTDRPSEAPSMGSYMEKVATAILSGATYAEVEAALEKVKRKRKGRAA